VFVLPVIRTDRRMPMHVPIDPPEGGVAARSYIVCDALCSIAKERLGPRAWGPRLRNDVTQSGGPSGLLLALRVSPHRLLDRTPVAAWRRALGGWEALEPEVNGTDPQHG
jgi:hypothetical protein